MKIKRVLAYVAMAAALSLVFVSCSKDEEFEDDQLIGRWQVVVFNGNDITAKGEYWLFKGDHTGSSWEELTGSSMGELPFTWSLDGNKLLVLHQVGDGQRVARLNGQRAVATQSITITELTPTRMRWSDMSDRYELVKK